MPFFEHNQGNIYYKIIGSKKPVIFLSGFLSPHQTWEKIYPNFKNDYQLILLDNRGIGKTKNGLASFTLETMADDTLKLLEILKITKAHFIASSMGGAILQIIASKKPSIVDKSVLISPFYNLQPHIKFVIKLCIKLHENKVPFDLIFKTIVPWIFGPNNLNQVKNIDEKSIGINEALESNNFNNSISQLEAMQGFDSSNFIVKNGSQFLVIAGGKDLTYPSGTQLNIHKQINHARVKIIADAGHMVYLENFDEVTSLIKNHIKN